MLGGYAREGEIVGIVRLIDPDRVPTGVRLIIDIAGYRSSWAPVDVHLPSQVSAGLCQEVTLESLRGRGTVAVNAIPEVAGAVLGAPVLRVVFGDAKISTWRWAEFPGERGPDGVWRFRGIPVGQHSARLVRGPLETEPVEVLVRDGSQTTTVFSTPRLEGVLLRVRRLGTGQRLLDTAVTFKSRDGGELAVARLSAVGESTFIPLEPGSYDLLLYHEGFVPRQLPTVVGSSEITRLDVELRHETR